MRIVFALFFAMTTLLSQTIPDLNQLQKMTDRFVKAELRSDTHQLPAGDQRALVKLIQASQLLDHIFLQQLWSGNLGLYTELQKDKSPLGQARMHYFWMNKGPWSDLDGHTAFMPGVPARKPLGANFYPEGMTKDDFETWAAKLSKEQREQAEGFFTVIRKDPGGRLKTVPFSQEYKPDLEKAAGLLREAAAATDNASLRKFLTLRADAFLSNDYYASDLAWMDLDAPIDITIGPYETYNDELLGYKAGYEAYVNLRDDQETAKIGFFGNHLQEVEDNLPIDAQYRNARLGGQAPIRVVNEVFSAGDGNHGVQTAAYNLPNDERVITQKGSKRVMLKNVQEAKFKQTLIPISKRVLPPASMSDVSFDSFFTHIVAHEMTHGIGPHQIKVSGRATTPRQELKELYSAIEEAKADVTGLFMLQYMFDHKLMPGGPEAERKLYTTYLASSFRTLRFGANDAHGKGMAVQFNYLMDHGAFVAKPDGTFAVDPAKMKAAVRDLDHELLTIEAKGDYAGAKHMLDGLGLLRPVLTKAMDRLSDIPTDIEPVFVTANELLGSK
ncbi:MAG: dipeptidyl-peptidase 3 family protein [Bryobacteraceae bacterium]